MISVNQIYGFTHAQTQQIPDISAEAYLYVHTSGARLIHLRNGDDNRVFCAAFSTPPENNTGVFHILEHCVLCGSQKYPLKDPFSEIAKGTLHTFLNAMTYADKTLYPVAGVNEKDFFKMTDIYLNAVFFPRVLENKVIMLQEGRVFTLSTNGALKGVSGVVYNEMSGAYADPAERLKNRALEILYDKTPYMYDAGGAPDEIPALTHEYLRSCHTRFYSPENAFFFFYGDLEIEKYLKHIHENYLSVIAQNAREAPPEKKRLSAVPQSAGENPVFYTTPATTDKNYALITFRAQTDNDPFFTLTLNVLCRYLFEMENSPCKLAVFQENLGSELCSYVDSHAYYPAVYISLADCADSKALYDVITSAANDAAKNGFAPDLLASCLQATEFAIKEEDYGRTPKGLAYITHMASRALYEKDPYEPLRKKTHIEKLKNNTQLLTDALSFFSDPQTAKAAAGHTAAAPKENAEPPKINLSAFNPDEAFSENEILKAYQLRNDTKKVLETIPVLDLSEIEKTHKKIPFEAGGRTRFSYSRQETNGVSYMEFIFDLDYKNALCRHSTALAHLLSKLDTRNYSFSDLQNKITLNLGGLNISYSAAKSVKDGAFAPKFVISVKALDEKTDFAFEYVSEIINNTKFTELARAEFLIAELKTQLFESIINNGHAWALTRASAAVSEADAYNEIISGVSSYEFLSAQKDTARLCEALDALRRSVFTKDNFSFHLTAGSDSALKAAESFARGLNQANAGAGVFLPPDITDTTRFITDNPVCYNALAFNFSQSSRYSGKLCVIAGILNRDYLMNKIRIKGGAYGMGSMFDRTCKASFYSYRDPNIDKTFRAFRGIAAYLTRLRLSDRQIAQYIIGAINPLDAPKTPQASGALALSRHISGITDSDLAAEREQILSFNAGDIKDIAKIFMEPQISGIATFGSKDIKSWIHKESRAIRAIEQN